MNPQGEISTTPLTRHREDTRRHPRALFSVPLTLHHLAQGGIQRSNGITVDISEGGLGAVVPCSLQMGEAVTLQLHFSERMLDAAAIVRHSSPMSSGFEFVGLTPEERSQIVAAAGLIGSS